VFCVDCGFVWGEMGLVCCFLKEGEQTDARRARISHKFPKDCNRYRIKRNDKERPFPMHAFRRIGSGKSHHFNVLIKNGIVRYAVAATLRTLPMNMASEGFRPWTEKSGFEHHNRKKARRRRENH